jgi:hypothetical protein
VTKASQDGKSSFVVGGYLSPRKKDSFLLKDEVPVVVFTPAVPKPTKPEMSDSAKREFVLGVLEQTKITRRELLKETGLGRFAFL